jgi:hypothetical protein
MVATYLLSPWRHGGKQIDCSAPQQQSAGCPPFGRPAPTTLVDPPASGNFRQLLDHMPCAAVADEPHLRLPRLARQVAAVAVAIQLRRGVR